MKNNPVDTNQLYELRNIFFRKADLYWTVLCSVVSSPPSVVTPVKWIY